MEALGVNVCAGTTGNNEKTFNLTDYYAPHKHTDDLPPQPRRILFLGNKWIPANDNFKN